MMGVRTSPYCRLRCSSRQNSINWFSNDHALGVEEREPGPFGMETEQVELFAQLAMVAPLGFRQKSQVLVEFFWLGKAVP